MLPVSISNPSNLEQTARIIAENIPDPEIPVITLGDLGIVRDVFVDKDGVARVQLTPTYSGCPAIQVIEDDVCAALEEAGITCQIERVISPPWTTDWISEEGKEKLRAYGIAPPTKCAKSNSALFQHDTPDCPRCGSDNTDLISQFGSTPCKSHYQCNNCSEPFDYFKCL